MRLGRMTNRALYYSILIENRLPIEMVLVLLTKQKLTRDTAFRSTDFSRQGLVA